MGKRTTFISLALVVAAIAYFESFPAFMSSPTRSLMRKQDSDKQRLPEYDQSSIETMVNKMSTMEAMLLAFDGQTFRAYNVGPSKEVSFRYVKEIPLMVHALKTNFPKRFKPGQPVFQMVWTTGDYLKTKCVNKDAKCEHTKKFPPIVSFSTMHRDESVLPTVKAFPNPHYITCLYHWKLLDERTCRWEAVDKSPKWEDLTPTIIWRGSDFRQFLVVYDEYKNSVNGWLEKTFTEKKMANSTRTEIIDTLVEHWSDLSPRWRAAALTLKTQASGAPAPQWIDTRFTGASNEGLHKRFKEHGLDVSGQPMDAPAMSKFKYQIDYGGGGGTTWQGTLTKLQMPGVLFHHETPTKDWFYDMMEPWVHYIPVGTDLADLWVRYAWAQEHPDKAEAISEEASKLAEKLLSEEYMWQVYEDLFVNYLGKVVKAYKPERRMTWDDCLLQYRKNGIGVHEISECSGLHCRSEWKPGTFLDTF